MRGLVRQQIWSAPYGHLTKTGAKGRMHILRRCQRRQPL